MKNNIFYTSLFIIHILCIVVILFVHFSKKPKYNLENAEYLKNISKRDSIIYQQSLLIDSLRSSRKILIQNREINKKNVDAVINYIDSVTTPTLLNDSLVNQALLWAKDQSL